MIRYTLIRTLWIFIILFIVVSLNFILLRVAPEYPPPDPDQRDIYYERQRDDGFVTRVTLLEEVEEDAERMEEIREHGRELAGVAHFDDRNGTMWVYEDVPIMQQYASWMTNILTEWNWGYSTRIQVNVPVFDVLVSRIPVTVQLNLIALFFYIPIGFTLGIIAALKKNSTTDNAISTLVMIGISVPNFVVMSILVLFFGYTLGWLPTQFPASDIVGIIQLTAVVLPVLALASNPIAHLTRMTRAELTEVLTSDFLLLARTKGLTRPQAVVRHAMRNSMVPLVPGIIFSFVGLLSGSVVIEQIYSIPGTGRIFVRAMQEDDYNLVLGVTAFYTIISLFAVLLVDLSYGIVDPRIRMGARK